LYKPISYGGGKSQAFLTFLILPKPLLAPHLPNEQSPQSIVVVDLAGEALLYFVLYESLIKQALFFEALTFCIRATTS